MPRIDLEDEEEVKAEEKAVDLKRRSTLQCPECVFESEIPEEIGIHLERHRPIGFKAFTRKGLPLHRECPRKCGRYFIHEHHLTDEQRRQPYNEYKELRQHSVLCDGSTPLLKKTEELMAKIPGCPAHPELKFFSGPERGGHMRNQHPNWKADPRLNPNHPKYKAAGPMVSPPPPAQTIAVKAAPPEKEPLVVVDPKDTLQPADLSMTVTRTADQMRQLASAYRSYAKQLATRANEVDADANKLIEKHGK